MASEESVPLDAPLGVTGRPDIAACCWSLLLPSGFTDEDIDRVALANLARREPASVALVFPEVVSRLLEHSREHSESQGAQQFGPVVLRLFRPGRGGGQGAPRDPDAEVKAALYKHLRETCRVPHGEAIRRIRSEYPEVTSDKAIEMAIKRSTSGTFAFITSEKGMELLRERLRPHGLENWPALADALLEQDTATRPDWMQGSILRTRLRNPET